MKKVFFLACIALSFSFSSAIAQTSYDALIKKIDSAPANHWGVKRINYGNWSTTPGTENIWAVYIPKDKTYTLCINEMGKSSFKTYISVVAGKVTKEQKVAIEEACSKLSESKWKSAW